MCERTNSTIKSITAHANDLEVLLLVSAACPLVFLCLIGVLLNLTLKTRLGSCMRALAYWSSVTHIRIRKLNLTVDKLDSVLVSCMTMEQYSRKATRRFEGAPEELTFEEDMEDTSDPLGVVEEVEVTAAAALLGVSV